MNIPAHSKLGVLVAVLASSALVLGGCSSPPDDGSSPGDPSPEAIGAVDETLRAMLPEAILESGTVRVGGDFASPPVLLADTNDATKPAGLAPELTTKMGELLGVKFEWQATAWPGQLPGVESGALDIVMGQIIVSEERETGVLDLVPFYRDPYGILTPANADFEISSFADLCGKAIGATTGSFFVATLAEVNRTFCAPSGLRPITMPELSSNTAMATAVLSSQVDGAILTFGEVSSFAESNSDFGASQLPLEETALFYPDLIGIGISKSNPGLSEAIAGALQRLAKDGVYQDLTATYANPDGALSIDELVVNYLTGTPAGKFID